MFLFQFQNAVVNQKAQKVSGNGTNIGEKTFLSLSTATAESDKKDTISRYSKLLTKGGAKAVVRSWQ